MIDGDLIRDVFGNDLGYHLNDRRKNADRISRLSKFLDDQGIHVVAIVLYYQFFLSHERWNRKKYKELF